MSSDLESLGSIPAAAAAVALLLAASFSVGGLVVPTPRLQPGGIDDFLLRIPIGLCLIGTVGVGLGAAKWLSSGRSILLLAALALLGLIMAWCERASFAGQIVLQKRRRASWFALSPL